MPGLLTTELGHAADKQLLVKLLIVQDFNCVHSKELSVNEMKWMLNGCLKFFLTWFIL